MILDSSLLPLGSARLARYNLSALSPSPAVPPQEEVWPLPRIAIWRTHGGPFQLRSGPLVYSVGNTTITVFPDPARGAIDTA